MFRLSAWFDPQIREACHLDLAGNDKCSFDELSGSIDAVLQGDTYIDDCL
jgi:hypothetical protein